MAALAGLTLAVRQPNGVAPPVFSVDPSRPLADALKDIRAKRADTWRLPPETVTNGYCTVTAGGMALDVFALPCPPKLFRVCANLPERDVPDRSDPKMKWFGPGVHRLDEVRLVSGETLYLAPGALSGESSSLQ